MPTAKTLELMQVAPDFTLPAHTGRTVQLADYHQKQHVLLFFVRARNHMPIKEQVIHLGRMYGEFQREETEILLILHENITHAQSYAEHIEAPFPVLADPEQSIYQLYHLGRAYLIPTRTAMLIVNKEGLISYFKVNVDPWGWRHESRALVEHVRGLNMRNH